MKFQGWTFLRKRICSIVVLATFPTFAFQLSLAQDSTSAPPLLLQDSGPSLIPNSEPALPGIRVGSDPATSLDEELGLLRNELKAFHSKRNEVSAETKSAGDETDRASNVQRQQLLMLLSRLAARGISGKQPRVEESVEIKPDQVQIENVPSSTEERPSVPISDNMPDPFALGKVLFRSGDFVGAEQAFRKTPATDENRIMLKYLIATCLRKRSQWKSATAGYQEVANSDEDPVLRDLARWQLENILWHQKTEAQIEQMKKIRERSASIKQQASKKTTKPGT